MTEEKKDLPEGARICQIVRLEVVGEEGAPIFDIETYEGAKLVLASSVGESSALVQNSGRQIPYLVFESAWDAAKVRRRITLVPAGAWVVKEAKLLGVFNLVDTKNRITPWAGQPVLIYETPIDEVEVMGEGPDVLAALVKARDANSETP
jgi:hypothetical protein